MIHYMIIYNINIENSYIETSSYTRNLLITNSYTRNLNIYIENFYINNSININPTIEHFTTDSQNLHMKKLPIDKEKIPIDCKNFHIDPKE